MKDSEFTWKATQTPPPPSAPPPPTKARNWPPWYVWVIGALVALFVIGTLVGEPPDRERAEADDGADYRADVNALVVEMAGETQRMLVLLQEQAWGNPIWIAAIEERADKVRRLAIRIDVLDAPDTPRWRRVTRYLRPAVDEYADAASLIKDAVAYSDVDALDRALTKLERGNRLLDDAAAEMPSR